MSAKKILCITSGCILGGLAAVYIAGGVYFGSHFLPNTVLTGIGEISNQKTEDLVGEFQKEVDSYQLNITGDKTADVIYGKEVSLAMDRSSAKKAADTLLEQQNSWTWPVRLFGKKQNLTTPSYAVQYDEAALKSMLKSLSCVTTTDIVKTENAKLDIDEDGYIIKEEVYGNEVDQKAFAKKLDEDILSLAPELKLRDDMCYIQPTVKKDDETLNDQMNKLNRYMKANITYDMGDRTYEVSKEEQSKWVKINKKGKVVFDEEGLSAFVKSMGYKFNTFGLPRELKTSYGPTVTVSGGNYGWWINYDAEKEQLKKDVKGGKDVTRDFIYHYDAANHGSYKHDYGDSYVEINLSTQHLFLIVDGERVFESDFVSGNTGLKRGTPTGVYRVNYKEKDATLKGENYSSDVAFWMPFNGNIGMHDAPWRSSFGGNIYKTNGSHGCINLPPKSAETIFGYVKSGFPVIVYQMPTSSAKKASE
ncbi:Putative peptidoglycan binding domain-containing protein [Lachnospiraceae bacterium KHCPX20]|nr:Putative peptidoglycan binding domain-containing protein [Lachnospiraceae bacterium KHCPX20]